MVGAVFTEGGRKLSATGSGWTRRMALAACLGEVAETLAVAKPDDGHPRAPPRRPPAAAGFSAAEVEAAVLLAARFGVDPEAPCAWIAARSLPERSASLLPDFAAASVWRTPPGAPAASIGRATGPCFGIAELSAALEVLERAASSVWDGRSGVRLDAGDVSPAVARMTAAGGSAPTLLRIDGGGGPPVVAALGRFGHGVAAGRSVEEAADAAVREMIAAETGAALAAAKSGKPPPPRLAPRCAEPSASAGSLETALSALSAAGTPVRVARLSAPDHAACVVKAVCFGL